MAEAMHLFIAGRVQGVGYRYFASSAARQLGLSGWVRNLPGGEVEVAAAGAPQALAAFRAALVRGPRWSRVDSVREAPPVATDLGPGFEVIG